MPESPDCDRLQLHEQAIYNVWKGQLYVHDQLICDLAFQSPFNCCIPSQLSEKLVIKEVIQLPELIKTLPDDIFEKTSLIGQEVCCESVYCSFYQVLTSNNDGSHLGRLQQWMQDKELALVTFLNDQGVLILLPSSVFQPNKELTQDDSSRFIVLFVFPHTKIVGEIEAEEWKSKFTKQDISLKVTHLLPCLQYAISETSNSGKEKELFPDALVEQYLKNYAVLQKKKDSSELGMHLLDPAPVLREDPYVNTGKSGEEGCSRTDFAKLQAYISSPFNFCVSVLTALTLVAEESPDMNVDNGSSIKVIGVTVHDSQAAETRPESNATQEPNGKVHEKKSPSKKGKKKGSRKGKATKIQMSSPSPEKREAKSDIQMNSSHSEEQTLVSSTSKTMLKLASPQLSHKRKRGAEVLTAEFVKDNKVDLDKKGASSKKRKKELAVRPPTRIMPVRISRSVVPPQQSIVPDRSPDRPPKRKASEQAITALSESKAKLENLRRLVNKHAEAVVRHSKRNVDNLKSEQENSINTLEERPNLDTKTLSSADIPMENIFEKRMNMYEAHALNLLADLALNSFGTSGIPYAPVENAVTEPEPVAKQKTVEEKVVEDQDHKSLNNPENSDSSEAADSAINFVQSQESSQTTVEDKPSIESDANQVNSTSPKSIESGEKSVVSKVHFAVAKAKARSNATSKICLEHSYSQLPLDLASASPISVDSKQPADQNVNDTSTLPASTEVVFEPATNVYFPNEIIFLTSDTPVLCPVVKKEPRDVLKFGNNFLVTFNWEAKYDFDLDSKFTSDPLEKTINRALHGPWNPHLKEKVEDVKIILHMWLALFYNKSSKQLSCSSRKVVEHSNPAKYVSINTIMDPFELYEIVDSENVEIGLSQLPTASTQDSSLDASIANSCQTSNTGKSLVPVSHKSDKKQKRNHGKEYLGVFTDVLQQLNADKTEEDSYKEVCSFNRIQKDIDQEQNTYQKIDISTPTKTNADTKSPKKKDIFDPPAWVLSTESENCYKSDMDPFQDVNKSMPNKAWNKNVVRISFPYTGYGSHFKKPNNSSQIKNLPDANIIPLPVVKVITVSSDGKKEDELPSDNSGDAMELERSAKSSHLFDTEVGVQGEVLYENISDQEENYDLKNEKDKSKFEEASDCVPSTIKHSKAADSVPDFDKNKNLEGIHDLLDLTLQNSDDKREFVAQKEQLTKPHSDTSSNEKVGLKEFVLNSSCNAVTRTPFENVFHTSKSLSDVTNLLTGNLDKRLSSGPLLSGKKSANKREELNTRIIGKKDTLAVECFATNTDMQTIGDDKELKSYVSDNRTSNTEALRTMQTQHEESYLFENEKSNMCLELVGNICKSSGISQSNLYEDPQRRAQPSRQGSETMECSAVSVERKDIAGEDGLEVASVNHRQPGIVSCNTISNGDSVCRDGSLEVYNGFAKKISSENLDQTLKLTTQVELSDSSENCDVSQKRPVEHHESAPIEDSLLAQKDVRKTVQPLTTSECLKDKGERKEPVVLPEIPSLESVADLKMVKTTGQVTELTTSKKVANLEIKEKEHVNTCLMYATQEELNNNINSIKHLTEKFVSVQEQIDLDGQKSQEDTVIPADTSSVNYIVPNQAGDKNGVRTDHPITDHESSVEICSFNDETSKHTILVETEKKKIPFHQTHVKTVVEPFQIFKICERIIPPRELHITKDTMDINGLNKSISPPRSPSILSDIFVDECNVDETERLVANAIKTLDQDLNRDGDDSYQNRSIPSNETNTQVDIVSVDLASPADTQNLSVGNKESEISSAIVIDIDKEEHSSKSSGKEPTILMDDKCASDVTDVSMDCTSPERYIGMKKNECEIIILDGNISMSSTEPEPFKEALSIPTQNNGTLLTQGQFGENIEQNIIQEHSDICFIASTASISEEQYERWSEASHEDIDFLRPSYKESTDVPKISHARESYPCSPRSSSPVETCHEPVYSKEAKRFEKQPDLFQEEDGYLPRYRRDPDYYCSHSSGNITVTNKEAGRTSQTINRRKSDLDRLFFSQRIITDDLTQNTLDMEHLRFIHRLKLVLRNACTDKLFSESPSRTIFETSRISGCSSSSNRKRSPLLITINCSNRKKESRRHNHWYPDRNYSPVYVDEGPTESSACNPRTRKKVSAYKRASSPFHFSRLKYENKLEKSNHDISLILNECVQTNHLKLSRVSLGNTVTDRTLNRELVDECVQTKKIFAPLSHKVPAVKNIISDLCTSLHSRLHSVAKEYSQRKFRFYIHETSDDPFFSQTKSLLKKDGHTATEPHHFCNSKHMESERLLVIIRNEDISSHIHKIPCLVQLKLDPNVSFVGVDCPEDITDSNYEDLFQAGGFVVSDPSILESMTLGKVKDVAEVLETLNKASVWKWLVHYRENRKLKEDKRVDSASHSKIALLKSYQEINIVEILPYHQCDSRSKAQTDDHTCVVNLQSQHILSRLAVYLTDKPSSVAEELEHKGILVFDVDTFIRKIQELDLQVRVSSWS
ncbi:protein TASOR 2 [Pelobates fuscus]|uniref:protein TASOR 2 n=1 Tax=Pelobates fuscus TaxID=191477 RepID=UPI002FE47B45